MTRKACVFMRTYNLGTSRRSPSDRVECEVVAGQLSGRFAHQRQRVPSPERPDAVVSSPFWAAGQSFELSRQPPVRAAFVPTVIWLSRSRGWQVTKISSHGWRIPPEKGRTQAQAGRTPHDRLGGGSPRSVGEQSERIRTASHRIRCAVARARVTHGPISASTASEVQAPAWIHRPWHTVRKPNGTCAVVVI